MPLLLVAGQRAGRLERQWGLGAERAQAGGGAQRRGQRQRVLRRQQRRHQGGGGGVPALVRGTSSGRLGVTREGVQTRVLRWS